MYNKTRRKNLTSFDYAIRVVFIVLVAGFVLTVLFLEPFLDELVQTNLEIQQEVTALEEENEVIDANNKNYITILIKD